MHAPRLISTPRAAEMTILGILVAFGVLLASSDGVHHHGTTPSPKPKTLEDVLHDKMDKLELLLEQVSRQLMLQQLFVNEYSRNTYDTGIKQLRYTKVGPKPYDSQSFTGEAAGAFHDHPDHYRVVGMGEVDAVLNGFDFRTRHNDYNLQMPVDDAGLNVVQDIPFPSVPQAVTRLTNVQDQINEMREWFKAWSTQNVTHRPYKDHFKPVLCYLEGAWVKDVDKLQEPAKVDGHHFDAFSQDDMHQKIRFAAYSGLQSSTEDLAYLPSYMMSVAAARNIELARWHYRIACQPLKNDVPLRKLVLVDDLSARISNNHTLDEYRRSPSARFSLQRNGGHYSYLVDLLDDAMIQIPGKNGYAATLTENTLNQVVYDIHYTKNYTELNTARYHRLYKVGNPGAMGVRNTHRAFADNSIFMAQTNLSDVSSLSVTECHWNRTIHRTKCRKTTRRYTYAIPLEIIYMTPLHAWNPHNIEYKGDAASASGKTVTAGGRTGGWTNNHAYSGTNSKTWFHTPRDFFGKQNPTDKNQKVAGVLDRHGSVHHVMASGIRTFLPDIPHLGVLRTRFPIYKAYIEGLAAMKELDALKDVAMNINSYSAVFEKNPLIFQKNPILSGAKPAIHFLVKQSGASYSHHTHQLFVTFNQMETLGAGHPISNLTTTFNSGHSHKVTVFFHPATNQFEIKECDGHPTCPDGHPKTLIVEHN